MTGRIYANSSSVYFCCCHIVSLDIIPRPYIAWMALGWRNLTELFFADIVQSCQLRQVRQARGTTCFYTPDRVNTGRRIRKTEVYRKTKDSLSYRLVLLTGYAQSLQNSIRQLDG